MLLVVRAGIFCKGANFVKASLQKSAIDLIVDARQRV